MEPRASILQCFGGKTRLKPVVNLQLVAITHVYYRVFLRTKSSSWDRKHQDSPSPFLINHMKLLASIQTEDECHFIMNTGTNLLLSTVYEIFCQPPSPEGHWRIFDVCYLLRLLAAIAVNAASSFHHSHSQPESRLRLWFPRGIFEKAANLPQYMDFMD